MRPSTTVGAGGMSRSRNAPQLDQKGQQLVKKLQDESSGAEFDRDYVHAQLEGHHQLLQIQERYLNAGQEPDVANVAKLARVIIREHMALLDDINSRLKG
jgi:putative membrane protein